MLEKQYSVQFFTSLVESMQKVCREYLQFDQVVELSGYLSLEIDNTKKERYVVSELLHSSGNVISESYCTKAFKTVPSVAVAADAAKRKDSSSYEGLGEVSGRLEKQSTGEYSRQFSNQSFSGSGGQDASTALFGNKNHLKVNNSYHQNDVSQSPQDQFSYSSADWELSSLQCGTTDINRDVMQITPSISNSSDRLAGTTTKRKSVHLPTSRESKRGKISSGNEKSECLLSTTTTSSVLNNLDSHNEQPNSLFSTTSDSQSSLPNIKRESDSSMHFVQVEDVEDCVAGGGLTNLSNDQHFRGLAGTDSKSMNENFQTNPATWEEANANSVELFKKWENDVTIQLQTKTQVSSVHQKPFPRYNLQNPFLMKMGRPMFQIPKKLLQCSTCGMKYLSEAGLMFHKCRSNSSGKGSVKCPLCSKTFYNRQSMKRHQAVHSPLKPYSCEICGAKFSSKTAMTQHLKYRHQSNQVMTMSWNSSNNESEVLSLVTAEIAHSASNQTNVTRSAGDQTHFAHTADVHADSECSTSDQPAFSQSANDLTEYTSSTNDDQGD